MAILAGAGALAAGSLGDGSAALCGLRLCQRLPAPITLRTARATFLIARDGRIRRAPAPHSEGPPGAAVFPATGSWYAFRHGHLIIGRGRRTVWRSPGAGWSTRRIGVVDVGGRRFAFQYAHRLYMGPVDGGVRAVARNELPLGWTDGRLYANSYPRRALVLRGPTGRLLGVLSPLPFHTGPVVADASVYLTLHGDLMRARGARARSLASLRSLGMSADSWLQSMGAMLELQDNHHLTILRPDGSVFASTPWPSRDGHAGTLSGSPVADASGHAVAFAVAYGQSPDPNASAWAQGQETVYVLRLGAHAAVPLHTEDVNFRVCERGAGVAWHGSWLLYSNSEGNVVLIDAGGLHRVIDLTAAAAALTVGRASADAYWTGQSGGV